MRDTTAAVLTMHVPNNHDKVHGRARHTNILYSVIGSRARPWALLRIAHRIDTSSPNFSVTYSLVKAH
jgi:hypothetical protein